MRKSGRFQLAVWRRRIIPIAALLLMIIVFTVLTGDRFFSVANATFLLNQAAVTTIPAIGITIVIMAGSIDLSVGSVVAFSGMAAALAAQSTGSLVGILTGLAVGAACGLVNGIVFAYLKIPSFIVTLGMLFAGRGLTLLVSGSHPVPVSGLMGSLGAAPGLFVVLVVAVVVGLFLMLFTRFGRQVMAIGGQERVSALSGIPVKRVKLEMFLVAGLLAGLGGIVLSARVGAATPTAASGFELTAIAAVVLGGTPLTGGYGNIAGTFIGALTLSVLLNGLIILGVSPEIQTVVQGVILVAAVWVSLDKKKIGIIK